MKACRPCITFKLTAFPCFAGSSRIGIGRGEPSDTGSLKPNRASKMALDAKAPQPIANLRRVNNIEFRASTCSVSSCLLDPIDVGFMRVFCCGAYVRFWHKADIPRLSSNVRFRGFTTPRTLKRKSCPFHRGCWHELLPQNPAG